MEEAIKKETEKQILDLLHQYIEKTHHYIDGINLVYDFEDDKPYLLDVKIESDEWK